MTHSENRLIRSLGELCAERVLDDKVLLAPTLRVGMQWLDAVARGGQPVLNFTVKTLRAFALELATPTMEERGLKLVNALRSEVLVSREFGRLRAGGRGYLSGLAPSPGLTDTLSRAVNDLRMAGLTAWDLEPGRFEVVAKGQEVKALLAGFEEALASGENVDYAGVLRLAIERLRGPASPLGASAVVAICEDNLAELGGLELLLWEAIPAGNRVVLEVDPPGEVPAGHATNAALLSFINSPGQAPVPEDIDATVSIFRAVGEVNEVREVLRRCVESRIPFDEVEILHTDGATYVPLIYELACRLKPEDPSAIPVTFAEGIPVIYSAPARALLGWVSWISGDFPQSVLIDLIADGLVGLDEAEAQDISNARLGAIFRAVRVGGGRDRYFDSIDRELSALGRQLAEGIIPADEDDEEEVPEDRDRRERGLRKRIAGLVAIRSLVSDLLAGVPPRGCTQQEFLECARTFLEKHARTGSKFDEYCSKKLVEDISAMAGCLADDDIDGFSPATWLNKLPRESSIGRNGPVEGKGPMPGCLYVSGIRGGGHSARAHTFIVGLDDSRFPGTGRQDPLLLDAERGRISPELPTGVGRLARDLDDFAGLMARLRGTVTMSYCCRSLADDREMFPSPVVLSAYRILGKRDGDQADLVRWVGDPASFAPASPTRCIDATEWWLSRTCGDAEVEGLERTVSLSFANLARGFAARAARQDGAFTEFDGYVPEAGASCDPTQPGGPALSASRLETLARCPLEYFFKYVLKIEPPEEYEIDPLVWLDPGKRGELLHSVFRKFMTSLKEQGLKPDFARDSALLRRVVDEEITYWQTRCPPPSAAVFEGEAHDLHVTARIFLQEEHLHCREHHPEFFEVSVGMAWDGEAGPLDCSEPVEVELPGGLKVRSLGRIDRIDRLASAEGDCYAIWDYKTGSAYGYRRDDPFLQGRHIQNAFYLKLANARLAEVRPGARAVTFGYFFPGPRAHGERVAWSDTELAAAGPILVSMCRMLATGCFPFTDRPEDDLAFSDYVAAFGDVAAAASDIRRKLENPRNLVLEPFRRLREYEQAIQEKEQ